MSRRVGLGDVSPAGRVRLDALARFLQDISDDDTRSIDYPDLLGWVVRRTVIEVRQFPVYGAVVDLATFCSGIGSRWAERRVQIAEAGGAPIVDAATIWVHLDLTTLRPAVLPPVFAEVFGEAAGGRTVRARLSHPDPPQPTDGAGAPSGGWADPTAEHPWPVRFSDYDVMGHVNNAAYWEAAEEALAARPELRAPLRAEIEFRTPIERADARSVRAVVREDGSALRVWLVSGAGQVHASVAVLPLRP